MFLLDFFGQYENVFKTARQKYGLIRLVDHIEIGGASAFELKFLYNWPKKNLHSDQKLLENLDKLRSYVPAVFHGTKVVLERDGQRFQ